MYRGENMKEFLERWQRGGKAAPALARTWPFHRVTGIDNGEKA
jgi:hypothetical protein